MKYYVEATQNWRNNMMMICGEKLDDGLTFVGSYPS